MNKLSGPRKVSYVFMALALILVARFDLGPALIAGLFALMILDQAQDALLSAGVKPGLARWTSVGLFAVIGFLLGMIFAAFARIAMARLPLLLDLLLPRLDELASRFDVGLSLGSSQELRAWVLQTLRENAHTVSSFSGLLTRDFFQIVGAIIVAVLHFLSSPQKPQNEEEPLDVVLLRESGERVSLFLKSFELVMGAQILIAAINAIVAFVFMAALQIPFRTMLTLAAFIFGLIPIVGNIVSNVLIVGAALTVSNHLALLAFVFLVLVHKGGYFLNSHIVSSRLKTPVWAILLGLLVGEALLGVTGLILAPSLIDYVRAELRAVAG